MKLDIIVPLYNEEHNIEPLYNKISKELNNIKYNIIFIDDGSFDNSLNELRKLYKVNKNNVKVISFSRNFGKESAMFAGLKASNAKYACIIDADLQQNPKYILDMYNFLEEHDEYDEVAMVNDYSNVSLLSKCLKKTFYKVMEKATGQNTVTGASDFRLMRKDVVNALVSMQETNRFSKGLFNWIGFNTHYMPYNVEDRFSGESKFKLRRQFSYAKDGIVNFSTKPLKIATILGSLISTGAFIYLIQIIIQTLIFGKDVNGYASIMCTILLLGGIQLLVLGIIGEYIAKSYLEVKKRPIYIAKTTLGFDDDIL